jgi:branched-chain amino acid aminotransferase
MQSSNVAYVNGAFLPEADARVPISDHGFLYGAGVFETMRAYNGKIFALDAHLLRLRDGLRALEIKNSADFSQILSELIAKNGITDGIVRLYVTRDSVVATTRAEPLPEFGQTASVCVATGVRVDEFSQLSRIKSANRLHFLLAQREAQARGFDDAVLLNAQNRVAEATRSNVFVVKNGEIFTPPLADGALGGITRAWVLRNFSVTEQSFGVLDLTMADEIFLTNSRREVVSVSKFMGKTLADHKMARAVQEKLRAAAQSDSMPRP